MEEYSDRQKNENDSPLEEQTTSSSSQVEQEIEEKKVDETGVTEPERSSTLEPENEEQAVENEQYVSNNSKNTFSKTNI